MHKFGGKIRTTGFLHRKETTEQNKERGNLQPSKQQKEDNAEFCILFFIYI